MSTHLPPFPLQRPEGLLIRPPVANDVPALAAFNARLHAGVEGGTDENLRLYTLELLTENHPTVTLADCLIAVDPAADGRIVATALQIPQTWRYEDVPFGVGRPELVGTDPDYRQRGLMGQLLNLLHARSAAQGHLLQAITGIPWLYRRYGYEMAADLHGSRRLPAKALSKEESGYTVRPATVADLPLLRILYDKQCAGSPLVCVRDDAVWRHLLRANSAHMNPDIFVLEKAGAGAAGYAEGRPRRSDDDAYLYAMAVVDGQSLRAAALGLAQAWLHGADGDRPVAADLVLELGRSHPVYDALGRQLVANRDPYGWYLRVADLPRFLRHVAPVLDRRLAAGPMAGHSGTLRLNLFQQRLALRFAAGRLSAVDTYSPRRLHDGDAVFPGLSFLQLLFGRATIAQLHEALPDCFTSNAETEVLLTSLFPTRPTLVNALG